MVNILPHWREGGIFLCYIVIMISRTRTLVQFVGGELVGSVVYFPYWWYTTGLFGLIHWFQRALRFRWKSYGLGIWLRHFFVPMYGQYDWSGRLVSIVMRAVVLFGRGIALFLELGLYMIGVGGSCAALALLLFFLNLHRVCGHLPHSRICFRYA